MTNKNKIVVIGCGKVGYSHLKWLADRNFEVVGYDSNPRALEKIRQNLGLQHVAYSWHDLSNCSCAHICVPTDPNTDGSTDLHIFESVIDELSVLDAKGTLQIISQRSTCPPGTADRLAQQFDRAAYGVNPSFLRKSSIEGDTIHPDRIAYGGDERFVSHMEDIYEGIESTRFVTGSRALVELLKYTENSLDSVLLSFWNEMMMYAQDLGISTEQFTYLLQRIGDRQKFTSAARVPGRGFGMWCLPKDLRSLLSQIMSRDCPAHTLLGAQRTNELSVQKFGEGEIGSTELFVYGEDGFTLTERGIAQLKSFLR